MQVSQNLTKNYKNLCLLVEMVELEFDIKIAR